MNRSEEQDGADKLPAKHYLNHAFQSRDKTISTSYKLSALRRAIKNGHPKAAVHF